MKKYLMRIVWTLVFLSPAIGLVIAQPWSSSAAKPGGNTDKQIVRPVTAQGEPARGWSVQAEEAPGDFRCVGASPVAVDRGIVTCGRATDFTIACWKSTNHTVLCLRDPQVKRLARIAYEGSFPSEPATDSPIPLEVDLKYYGMCLVRDGGPTLAPPSQPTWAATYACTSTKHGSGYLFGAASQPGGIDQTKHLWVVHWKNEHRRNAKLVEDRVVTAYLVGNAV